MLKNIELPVIVSPMFLISNPKMVIECCKNGVIGSFPFTNARTIEILESWIKTIKNELKEQLCNTPWAANVITHSSYTKFDEELALISKYKPPIVITALGSPKRVIKTVKEYGGLVFADVNSIKYAKKCAETEVDGLILICSGAGGHTGNLSAFVFVNEVRKFWGGIIILAGGISTGSAIKSALALGADYAYMGTRFIAAKESTADDEYKEMVIKATSDDIITTKSVTGVSGNFLIPSLKQTGFDIDNLKDAKIDFKEYNDERKAWRDVWSAGQGVGDITKKETVSEIIKNLKEEYKNQ